MVYSPLSTVKQPYHAGSIRYAPHIGSGSQAIYVNNWRSRLGRSDNKCKRGKKPATTNAYCCDFLMEIERWRIARRVFDMHGKHNRFYAPHDK